MGGNVGTNMRGVWPAAFGDSVRFVILDGTEVSQATFRNWFLVHSVLLPVLAIGGAVLAWRLRRDSRREVSR